MLSAGLERLRSLLMRRELLRMRLLAGGRCVMAAPARGWGWMNGVRRKGHTLGWRASARV